MDRPFTSRLAALVVAATIAAPVLSAQRPAPRPMTFMDMQTMRQVGSPALSPDGQWALYTVSVPDWKEARRQNDVYIVSTTAGVPSTRRLTFTADKNEVAPAWSRDGKWFVFLSDRDAAPASGAARTPSLPTSGPGAPYFPPAVGGGVGGAGYQLYLMHPDGGEARKITGHTGDVSFSAQAWMPPAMLYES